MTSTEPTEGPVEGRPAAGPTGGPERSPAAGPEGGPAGRPDRSPEGRPEDPPVGEAAGRAGLQRGVIILPSSLTLGNLFFGIFSIVAATRGDYMWAAWSVIFAAALDMLDGRVARFTRTGSAFGGELDSLVDAISFGVAPGFLVYSLYLQETEWSWILAYVYVTAVVVRLARFNVEQLGRAKKHFHGLPSPTAGMLLASFYPFSQTPFFQTWMAPYQGPNVLGIGVVFLCVLMLSHVPYAVVPRVGWHGPRQIATTALLAGGVFATLTVPRYFIFPFLFLYTLWGFVRTVVLGLLERLPERDPLLDVEDEAEPDERDGERRTLDYGDVAPGRYGSRAANDRWRDTDPTSEETET